MYYAHKNPITLIFLVTTGTRRISYIGRASKREQQMDTRNNTRHGPHFFDFSKDDDDDDTVPQLLEKCHHSPIEGTIRKKSGVCEGDGLYATRKFRENEKIAYYVGELITEKEAALRENKSYMRKVYIFFFGYPILRTNSY